MTELDTSAVDANPRNWLTMSIAIGSGNVTSVDVLYASTDARTTIDGPIYPSDLALVSDIIRLIREHKDRYPPARKDA